MVAFHISVNSTCVLIWLTDSILRSLAILFVVILLLILELFSTLKSLFWAFCKSSRQPCTGSLFEVLTFPQRWMPYLNLELKILSAILFKLEKVCQKCVRFWFFSHTYILFRNESTIVELKVVFRTLSTKKGLVHVTPLTLGNNIDILKFFDIFMLSPILSLLNKSILMASSSWYSDRSRYINDNFIGMSWKRIVWAIILSVGDSNKTRYEIIFDMSCLTTKKVVIKLHLSTRYLTPYRRRLHPT